HRNWIRNYTPYRVPIRLADHRVIYSEGVGTVHCRPRRRLKAHGYGVKIPNKHTPG
ncbi:hypothetical protein CPC08DRAFT_797115, partial [Agrocybe pediades]